MLSEYCKPKNGFSSFYLGYSLSVSLSRSFFFLLSTRGNVSRSLLRRLKGNLGNQGSIGWLEWELDTERLFINLEGPGRVSLKNVSTSIHFIKSNYQERSSGTKSSVIWWSQYTTRTSMTFLCKNFRDHNNFSIICQDNYKPQ